MKKVFIFLMVLSLFTACDNNKIIPDKKTEFNKDADDDDNGKKKKEDYEDGGSWSSSDKSKFNRECLSGFTDDNQAMGRKICPCVLEKYQKKYSSYSEVQEANDEAEVKRIALQCKKQLAGNDDEDDSGNDFSKPDENDNEDSGGWTKADERKFVSGCSDNAAQNVGEDRANQYCKCMLSVIKRKYSSYASAERALGKMSKDDVAELAADCNQ